MNETSERQPTLAGGDRHQLDRLSAELGARGAQARLDAPLELRQLVRKAACVIHAAGPFEATFRPMIEACSAEGTPYVDLNGELDVFQALEDFTATHGANIPIVPGVGFGVAAGESAAMHAANQLAKPQRIWLGLAPDLGQRSSGALRSTLRTVSRGGTVVQDGQFVSERVGRRSFRAALQPQARTFISTPLGELWAIRRSTGVPNVIAGAAVPVAERILLQSGALGLLGRSERVRNWRAKHLAQDSGVGAPTFESLVWARAENNEGQVAVDPRPGLWTPGQYFGPEFAVAVTGTRLTQGMR